MSSFRILVAIVIALLPMKLRASELNDLRYETALVRSIVARTTPIDLRHYCIRGTMTCRTISVLADRQTGRSLNVYVNTFYSAERQVGSTSYFLPRAGGVYHVSLSDRVFDGQIIIDLKSPNQARIRREPAGAVVFSNLRLEVIGTTRYVFAELRQTEQAAVIVGEELDSRDPTHRKAVRIEYERVLRPPDKTTSLGLPAGAEAL